MIDGRSRTSLAALVAGPGRVAAHRPGLAGRGVAAGTGVVVRDGQALVAGDRLVLIPPAQAPEGERLFLGVDRAGTPYFAVDAAAAARPGPTTWPGPFGLREVGHILADLDAGLLMTAVALANWHTRHPYSPATGAATTVQRRRLGPGRRVRRRRCGRAPTRRSSCWCMTASPARTGCACWAATSPGPGARPARCRATPAWPASSSRASRPSRPWSARWPRRSACTSTDLQYVASQPWPYPGSLMLGFHALADPDDQITPDPTEIADARWFTRAEIRRPRPAIPTPASACPTRPRSPIS